MPAHDDTKTASPVAIDDVASLTAKLKAVTKERDQLAAQLATSEKCVKIACNERDQLSAKLQEKLLIEENLMTALASDAEIIIDLQNRLESPSLPSEDHVFLDGKCHKILWRSTVRDLSYEGYHKRQVSENQTAIVIAQEGG